MPFARRIIGPDERLVMVCRLHWIYVAQGVCWLALLGAGGFYADARLWDAFGYAIPDYSRDLFGVPVTFWTSPLKWMFTAAGLVFFITYFLKYIASEIALTSKRIIYKHGWLFVELEEIDLDEIKGERVHHGFFGWLLGYGTVFLDCRFIGDTLLPAVRRPYRFLKGVHSARARLADSIGFAVPLDMPQQPARPHPAQRHMPFPSVPASTPLATPAPQTPPDGPLAAPRRRRRKPAN